MKGHIPMKYLAFLLLFVSSFASAEYKRNDFGTWIDIDSNCKNTRVEILIRDADSIKSQTCNTVKGIWTDPYTGLKISDASMMDIDHIIPLKYAYDQGAKNWNKETKISLANDPVNLVAVSSHINRSKGSQGLSDWMPPNKDYRCEYIKRWKIISLKYNIELAPADKDTIKFYTPVCGK